MLFFGFGFPPKAPEMEGKSSRVTSGRREATDMLSQDHLQVPHGLFLIWIEELPMCIRIFLVLKRQFPVVNQTGG